MKWVGLVVWLFGFKVMAQPVHYDADAEHKSWQRLLTFLDEKLQ